MEIIMIKVCLKEKDNELEEILKKDDSFKYQLLGRMQCDCENYLHYGNKNTKHLWAKDEQKHIDYMKAIYESFKKKPQWIDMDKIEEYRKQMCYRVCPICGRKYKERPALSRMDNKTEICPECGLMEALAELDKELFI